MTLLIGEKLGMTHIYDKEGRFLAVTVVRMLSNTVTAVKSQERDGYTAVQLGYAPKKESRLNKSQKDFFKKIKVQPLALRKEFRTKNVESYQVGSVVGASVFQEGDKIHVQGISKGKGFQGVMKLHHFSGGPDSHGNSLSHRVPGSIGMRTDPGRVFKNTELPGHMGDEKTTIKNLEILGVEADQNLLLIKGAIPGAKKEKIFIFPQSPEFEKRMIDHLSSQQKTETVQENQTVEA